MLKLMKFEFKQNTLSYLGLFLIFLSLAFVVPVVHREMNASDSICCFGSYDNHRYFCECRKNLCELHV